MRRPPVGRLIALFVVLCLGLGGVVARLTVLQVREAEAYASLALEQRIREIPLPATRGSILDRTGEELALSLEARAVYADPRYVRDPVGTARRLAGILGGRVRQLVRKLRSEGSFVYLARQVDLQLAARVERLGLPGIGFLEESKRHYPARGLVAPQVLGFVGLDGEGLAGLEYQYEDVLSGRPGTRETEIDPFGRPIPHGVHREVPPVPGDDVVTTIDKNLQFRAQLALSRAVRRNHAKGGTVVVLDPHSGDVLAMATYPWFDPNLVAELSPWALRNHTRNRAVTDVYEPGSVNKVITAAAAVEERVLPLAQRLEVPYRWRIGDKVFSDDHPHPVQAMTLGDIIAHSSNIGTILVAGRLGAEALAQYLARFGFGQKTGVGFPGESAGILPALYEYWDTSMGTLPIGQGVAVTPLQMAAVYGAIATGGEWVQPRLVRGTVDPSGRFHPAPPPLSRRVVSERTARVVTRMLAYAVRAGTGTNAQIAGYWLAGKTGTARKPLPNALGYSEDKHVASFIGFLPASDPQVVIAAMLDEPTTVYGGVAAAPLFREVALHAIGRLRIAPGERLSLPPHALPVD